MTTNTTNQATSIDIYGDPRFEELSTALYRIGFHQAGSGDAEAKALADYIDAKLAREIWLRAKAEDRAQIAESRLAEIQRGVEGLSRYGFDGTFGGDFGWWPEGSYIKRSEVLALLQPQAKSTGCTHDCNQGRNCTCADTSGLPG